VTRLQIRRGTTAQWTAANPILAAGEPGLDTTTGLMKIGDGRTVWSALLAEWAPASMVASAPRGVIPAGIGSAINGATVTATGQMLCTTLTFTFDPTRRYRGWYVVRALTIGYINFNLWNVTTGAAIGGDQWLSADRNYGGATFTWLFSLSGTIGVNVRITANFTTNIAVYGRDFYIEDVGAV